MKEKRRCESAEVARASEKVGAPSSEVWSDFLVDIKEQCLTRNFGTLSKSEFDLLVFNYYLLEKQSNAAGKYVSDYDIGRELGLTIQRVRSLREREALKWEFRGNWRDSFLDCLKFAHCDEKRNVKIPVPDVNVMKEIRNFIETAGLIDDYQLNPKVFQCNLDALIAICLDFKSGRDDNLCGRILETLRESKDENVARAVDEQEHPIRSLIKKAAINGAQETIASIPYIGSASKEIVAKFLEKLR